MPAKLRNAMEHDLQDTLSLLARTPGVLNALLRELPEIWTSRNEGENTWSAFEVVGHLIHAERTDWMPRVRMVLQSGEAQPFPAFDRWGMAREIQGKSLAQLLDEFAALAIREPGSTARLELQPQIFSGVADILPSAWLLCQSCWPPGRRMT